MGERFVRARAGPDRLRASVPDKSVSPAFLFAALLWHEVLAAGKRNEGKDMRSIPALYLAMDQVLDAQTDKLSIPRRLTTTMKEIWSLQPRWNSARASAPSSCSSIRVFAPATISCCCAPRAAKCRWNSPTGGPASRTRTMEERNAMLIPDAAPKKRPRRRRKSATGGAPAPAQDGPES